LLFKGLSVRGLFCAVVFAAGVWRANAQTAVRVTQRSAGAFVWLGNTAQKDDITGWADILTPGVGMRLNRHFIVDANCPWY